MPIRPVHHPEPSVLADHLRRVADLIEGMGPRATAQAAMLSAVGWPPGTMGVDGSRSADQTSSTERAALTPHPFDRVDVELSQQLRLMWLTGVQLQGTISRIMAHATTEDMVLAGTGECLVRGCGHFCNPRKKGEDRLRAGFCPAHYRAWLRQGRPDRGRFINRRGNVEAVA